MTRNLQQLSISLMDFYGLVLVCSDMFPIKEGLIAEASFQL